MSCLGTSVLLIAIVFVSCLRGSGAQARLSFFIDQLSGVDSNSGLDAQHPVSSFEQALGLCRLAGLSCELVLLSEAYVLSTAVNVSLVDVLLSPLHSGFQISCNMSSPFYNVPFPNSKSVAPMFSIWNSSVSLQNLQMQNCPQFLNVYGNSSVAISNSSMFGSTFSSVSLYDQSVLSADRLHAHDCVSNFFDVSHVFLHVCSSCSASLSNSVVQRMVSFVSPIITNYGTLEFVSCDVLALSNQFADTGILSQGPTSVFVANNTRFSDSTVLSGSLVLVQSPKASFFNVQFSQNSASPTLLYLYELSVVLTNVEFSQNSVVQQDLPCAMLVQMFDQGHPSSVWNNVTFMNHSASCGTSIVSAAAPFTATGVRFVGNFGPQNGLVFANVEGISTAAVQLITDLMFTDNYFSGSAVLLQTGPVSLYVKDFVFESNVLGSGSALKSTVAFGLSYYGQISLPVQLLNGVFRNNTCLDAHCVGPALSVSFTPSQSTVSNVSFIHNIGSAAGSAWIQGPIQFSDCLFLQNVANVGNGGAVVLNFPTKEGASFFSRCKFLQNVAMRRGGAIASFSIPLDVSNCTFEGNSALDGGGAIFLSDAESILNVTISFTSTRFIRNHGVEIATGGALYVSMNYDVYIRNCLFVGNVASLNPVLGIAGAIYLIGSSVTVYQSNFTRNFATIDPADATAFRWGRGGAILIDTHATMFLTEVVFIDNSIVPSQFGFGLGGTIFAIGALYASRINIRGSYASQGGAIFIDSGCLQVKISSSVISHANAFTSGGAIFYQSSLYGFLLENSTVENFGNIAGAAYLQGGALYASSGGIIIRDCVFTNGTANQGAGLFVQANIVIERSHFTWLVAADAGAVIYLDTASSCAAIISTELVIPRDPSLYKHNSALGRGGLLLFSSSTVCNTPALIDVASQLSNLSLSLQSFGNVAPYGLGFGSPPSLLSVLHNGSSFVFPGETVKFMVLVTDSVGAIVSSASSFGLYVYCTYLPVSAMGLDGLNQSATASCLASGSSSAVAVGGIAQFEVSFFPSSPSFSHDLHVFVSSSLLPPSSQSPYEYPHVYTVSPILWSASFSLSFTKCPPGYRLSSSVCIKCESSEYSLNYDSPVCNQCDDISEETKFLAVGCFSSGNAVYAGPGSYVRNDGSSSGSAIVYGCLSGYCDGISASEAQQMVRSGDVIPGETFNKCNRGNTGFLCGMCTENWSLWSGQCVDCSSGPNVPLLFGYAVFIVVFVFFQHLVAQTSGSRFKIMTSFLQLTSSIQPGSFLLVSVFRIQSGSSCPFYRSDDSVFWIDLCIPLLVFGHSFVMFFLAAVLNRFFQFTTSSSNPFFKTLWRARAFFRSQVLLAMVLYASISSLGIEFLDCHEYPTGETVLWLKPGISCKEAAYKNFMQPFAVVLFVLSIAVPVVIGVLLMLLKRRRRILDPSSGPMLTAMSRVGYAFGPLYESYKPQYYWYESIFLLRRVIFYAVPVLIWDRSSSGSSSAVGEMCMVGLILTFLLIHHWLQPFAKPDDNFFEFVSLYTVLFLTCISAIERANSTYTPGTGSWNALQIVFWLVFGCVLFYMVVVVLAHLWRRIAHRKGLPEGAMSPPRSRANTLRRVMTPDHDSLGQLELRLLSSDDGNSLATESSPLCTN
eukprot:ANDGO_01508.mRNA.1 hypothetical protein H310_06311